MAKASCGLSALPFLGATILLLLAGTSPAAANKIPVSFGVIPGSLYVPTDIALANYTKAHVLKKRVVTLTWDGALAKGQTILNLIHAGRPNTPWTTSAQLEQNGWQISDPKEDEYTDDYNQPGGLFEQLGIEQSEGHAVNAEQYADFQNCYSDHVPATGGFFDQVYNVPGRAIMAITNYSPLYMVSSRNPTVAREQLARFMPAPYKWSEIVWPIWAEISTDPEYNAHPNSLKYIFKHEVATANTRYIMERAENVGEGALRAEWPGIRYLSGSQQYQALMGTPHGTSMAWLLIDHPNDLGGREIESITMFTTLGDDYHLLFTLDDPPA